LNLPFHKTILITKGWFMNLEKQHSKLSASGSHIWINCPGSVKLSETAPPKDIHPSGIVGTVAHYVAEKSIMHRLHPQEMDDPAGLLGDLINDVIVDRQMIHHAIQYADYVTGLMKDDGELSIEQRVELEHIHPAMFGTADIVIKHKDLSVDVVDYKYGEWPVDALNNPQLVYYMIGACKTFTPSECRVHIFQPRSRDGQPVKIWAFHKDVLAHWEQEFTLQAKATDIGTPIARGHWCRFCQAKPVCPLHNPHI
jgi:hypothetical protein